MNLNQDKVPTNLDDALAIIKEGLSAEDTLTIKTPKFSPAMAHFTVGMMLRNEWSLWDENTVLVQWFKQTYGIQHADDISGIIIDCLEKDIKGLPRRDKELAKEYLDHWKKYK